jgi:hypothetical protein
MVEDGLPEETQGSGDIPLRRQQEIYCLTFSIERPVQIFPPASDFDIDFIHSPPATHGTFMPAERPVQPGHHADNPEVKRRMVTHNAPSSIISSRFRRLRE